MCGIVGLFAKTPEVEAKLGEHLSAMLIEMTDRGPDSAGVAVYRNPVDEDGALKLSLHIQPIRTFSWSALAARAGRGAGRYGRPSRCAAATPWWSCTIRRSAWCAAGSTHKHPDLAVVSAGSRDRDLQGDGPAGRGRPSASSCASLSRQPCARPHPHGDRERGHHRALPSLLDRPRPLPGAQRLAVEPQPPAPGACGAKVSTFQTDNDTEVAAGYLTLQLQKGASLKTGARERDRGPRRLLHLRGRHQGRLRRGARSDRLQARRARRDRRLGRHGLGVPRHRAPAGRRQGAHLGAGAGTQIYSWERN